jgi:hypothetical protein
MISIRISSAAWVLIGLSLSAWSAWGLATQFEFASVLASWCIGLGYGLIALGGGALAMRKTRAGCWLLVAASCLTLLYAVAYVLFDGFHDAPSYLPSVIGLTVLSIFTLLLFPHFKANAT